MWGWNIDEEYIYEGKRGFTMGGRRIGGAFKGKKEACLLAQNDRKVTIYYRRIRGIYPTYWYVGLVHVLLV